MKNEIEKSDPPTDKVGFFCILNLHFFATDEEIKRNYSELRAIYSEENAANLEFRDLNSSKEILDKLGAAYFILEDKENKKKNYLHMISMLYFLSQPFDLEIVHSKYGKIKEQLNKNIILKASRIFPYTIFEVERKISNSFSARILKFDFLDRILTEYKDEKYVRAFNFSSFIGGITGFKKDEFLLNVLESNDSCIHHFRVKYIFQRDLIVQIVLLAKDLHEKRNSQLLQHKNPNTEKFQTNQKLKIVRQSDIKLMNNDRLVPPMSLKKYIVFKKQGIDNENKMFWILGICQLIIAKDENCCEIIKIFPLNGKVISISKSKENNALFLNANDEKMIFYFLSEEEASDCCKITIKVLNRFIIKENAIITFPHTRKDNFITKLKRDKLKKLFKKIEETEKYLEELNQTRSNLEAEIINEENPMNVMSRNSIRNVEFGENFEDHIDFNEKKEDLDEN